MYAVDFEYDGQYLSDYGFTICDFDNTSGFQTVSGGSKITFNKVARNRGERYGLTSTQYDECIEASFYICKDPCEYDDMIITNDEYRDLARWLNRTRYLKFRMISEDGLSDTCYYDASFNIEKVLTDRMLYGLRLTLDTNRPFGYGETVKYDFNVTDTSKQYIVSDMSDTIGYTYPTIIITVSEAGNLAVNNLTSGSMMVIKNCSSGETISVFGDTKIVQSSNDSHAIYDDFNFEFFRIENSIDNRNNFVTFSLPCTVSISYDPIIKDAPE